MPDGIGTSSEIPLKICLRKNYFELVYLLLTKGADPRNLSVTQGDTPLHAAVFICLNNKGKAFAVESIPIPYLPLLLLQGQWIRMSGCVSLSPQSLQARGYTQSLLS